MEKPDKYVVILEIPDTGYMDCIAICNKAEEAYGEAYLMLCDDVAEDEYSISTPQTREGENGFMLYQIKKATGDINRIATVLFYREEEKK